LCYTQLDFRVWGESTPPNCHNHKPPQPPTLPGVSPTDVGISVSSGCAAACAAPSTPRLAPAARPSAALCVGQHLPYTHITRHTMCAPGTPHLAPQAHLCRASPHLLMAWPDGWTWWKGLADGPGLIVPRLLHAAAGLTDGWWFWWWLRSLAGRMKWMDLPKGMLGLRDGMAVWVG